MVFWFMFYSDIREALQKSLGACPDKSAVGSKIECLFDQDLRYHTMG